MCGKSPFTSWCGGFPCKTGRFWMILSGTLLHGQWPCLRANVMWPSITSTMSPAWHLTCHALAEKVVKVMPTREDSKRRTRLAQETHLCQIRMHPPKACRFDRNLLSGRPLCRFHVILSGRGGGGGGGAGVTSKPFPVKMHHRPLKILIAAKHDAAGNRLRDVHIWRAYLEACKQVITMSYLAPKQSEHAHTQSGSKNPRYG